MAAVISVARDITDRKKAEAEGEKLQAQLLQAQKLEAVGRLAGGVAHDFNNLLTVILGYGEMVLEDLHPDHPHHQLLTHIRDAGNRARNLTRQLLAFSRKQVLDMEVVDLNGVVSGFEKLMRRLIGEDVLLKMALHAEPFARQSGCLSGGTGADESGRQRSGRDARRRGPHHRDRN